MASLEGVKVIDMVGGEITKVAYDGAEYAKVSGDCITGDIALIIQDSSFFTTDAYYNVVEPYESGSPRMVDDDGDYYGPGGGAYVLFRKISASTSPTTIEERVTKLEAEVEALKGEEIAEEIEFDGAKYRKVDREAQAGDVVIFNGVERQSLWTKDGVPYKVLSGRTYRPEPNNSDYGVYGWRCGETVDVYEKVEAKKPTPKPFMKGDIVVITANTNSSRNAVGDIGKIGSEADCDGDFRVDVPSKPKVGGANDCWTKQKEMRHATAEEIAQYDAEVAPKYVPQEGDIVVVIENGTHHFNVGDVVKIVDFSGAGPNKIKGVKAGEEVGGGPYLYEHEIRKATPAEVAQYEKAVAEHVEAEKWAKIGRKVGEFKKGDIAKVIDSPCALPNGTIFTVSDVHRGDVYDDSEYEYVYMFPHKQLELIAPVEATL